MGLLCNRLEDCHFCPRGTPPQRCWWVITSGPWRLCRGCYVFETGRDPETDT